MDVAALLRQVVCWSVAGFVAAGCGLMLQIGGGKLCVGVLMNCCDKLRLEVAALLRQVVCWSVADLLREVVVGCCCFVVIDCVWECC